MANLNSVTRGAGVSSEIIEIRKGVKYTVFSGDGTEKPLKTEGEFVGYTLLGEDSAVVFRVDNGGKEKVMRLIPVANLFYIQFSEKDVVTKQEDKKTDSERTNYIS